MKRTLVCLDYNTSALKVAETGFLIAKGIDAEIIFLHSISNLELYSNVGNIIIKGFFAGHMKINTERSEKQSTADTLASDFLNKLKFHLGDKKIQAIVKKGNPENKIIETVKELNIDLIVIGKHSKDSAEKKIIGSTAQAILNSSTIPVIVVPAVKDE